MSDIAGPVTAGATTKYDLTTALIVVDMQNDFADPDGSLFVEGGDDIVTVINRQIDEATAAGAFVVYTQDWHPPQTPHFVTDGGIWPEHCIRGTWGAKLRSDLVVAGPIVQKGTNGEDGYSGFTMRDPVSGDEQPTELDALLRERGITKAVVVGLALDVCVQATALDAVSGGYQVTVLAEAARPVELAAGDGERAVAAMVEAGCAVV